MKKVLLVFTLGLMFVFCATWQFQSESKSEKHFKRGDVLEVTELVLYMSDVVSAYEESCGDIDLYHELLFSKSECNQMRNTRRAAQGGQYEIFGKTLTAAEILLSISHPVAAKLCFDASEEAQVFTNLHYPNSPDGSIGNAYLHSLWNVLMVKFIGNNLAQAFADAHEEYDGNVALYKYMDLYNNDTARSRFSTVYYNGITDYNLAYNVKAIIIEGGFAKYVIYDVDYLAQVTYYNTHTVYEYLTIDTYSWTDQEEAISLPEPEILDLRDNDNPGRIVF